MSQIQTFTNEEFGAIRVADHDGEPWFVAKDVCDALGLSNVSVSVASLDEDERAKLNLGRQGGTNIVSEPGFYKLVLKSRKPEAKAFQRWITHDVLPSIRKQGGYMTARADETAEETIARALLLAKDAMDRKDAEIAELRPKAMFADAVAASDGTCLVGELAKMIRQNGVQIGQNRLYEILRADGFLGKCGSNYNVPTQRSMELGLFRIKETAFAHADGHVTVNRTPKVTGRGQQYFINRYCHA